MAVPRSTLHFRSEDRVPLALVIATAAAFHLILGSVVIGSLGLSRSHLGLFYDGHIYIEIAKSFPLPFGIGARDYMGHAPGFPALIALVRLMTPDAWVDWGLAAELASTLPAALCAGAVYLLSRELGLSPLWPALLFVFANPFWSMLSVAAFAEPLALLLSLSSVLSILRGRLGISMVLLTCAGLTRFPMFLLGAPLALHWLVRSADGTGGLVERVFASVSLKDALWFALPLASFALYNAYLYWRVPDFAGISDSHSIFWVTWLSWPFESLWTGMRPGVWKSQALYATTYAALAFYIGSVLSGMLLLDRRHWILPLSVAIIVLFHASLAGMTGAWAFGRLTVIAWPFALLTVSKAAPALSRAPLAAVVCVALGICSSIFAAQRIPVAIAGQTRTQPFLPELADKLQSDDPTWIDFRTLRSSGSGRTRRPKD